MEREQPTADHDLAEVAETPASACAQDNESDGEQPRSPRRLRARLSSRLLGGNDATRRDTAKGGKKAAKKSRRSHVLRGHTDYVQCLAALDGDRLASGSTDHSIIVWNLAEGEQLAKLEGHTDKINCLAVLADGRLASGGGHWNQQKERWEGTDIIIWNLADGTQLFKLEGHEGSVRCLAAVDGNRLVSGSADESIIIWNLADGTQLAKLEGHTHIVTSLAALDGGRLASCSWDKSIIIWNLADGSQLAKLEGHTGEVSCLIALDGDRLASCAWDSSILVWNLADGEQLFKLEGHTWPVSSLAALAGDRLASGSSDFTIRVRHLD